MSTIPYFLRNPNLDDQAQQPMIMAPAAAPRGMAAQVVQHPMHAMIAPIVGAPLRMSTMRPAEDPGQEPAAMSQSDIAGIGGDQPMPTLPAQKQPKVVTMSPTDRYEDNINRRLMADYSKDQDPWGSADNHPGFLGKLGHFGSQLIANAHHVSGELTPRETEEQRLGGEVQKIEGEKSQQALQGAKTGAQEATADYTEQKPEIEKTRLQQQNNIASSKNASVLAKAGYKQDDDGTIVPMEYGEMSPAQQSTYDLKNAQQNLAKTTMELRGAQADFEKMKGDPNSLPNQQIAQRLQIAKQAQDRMTGMMGAMQERADAQMINAKAGAYGVGMDNQPLPGAMLTEQGQPVGSHFQANVRPTGAQRAKGNMAESADQQINDMKSIVSKRPDVFGPAGGRVTDFNVWVGSQDPDAQRFRAARTIAGDHLAGTFGGRSETALNALDSAIGHFKDNPKAVAAGLDQLQEANHLFLNAGKVHTVGGNQSAPGQTSPKANDPLGIR